MLRTSTKFEFPVFLAVIWLFSFKLVSCTDIKQGDVVKPTINGHVLGKEIILPDSNRVFAFLGIPYAEPPIGTLRFQPPIDRKNWTGILNATQFGPMCFQPEIIRIWIPNQDASGQNELSLTRLSSLPMSEDCLSLNVYTPKADADFGSLPVLVYVHGGSYGINAGRFYQGEKLASKGIIVVTFNYRLGPLGFFSTGDIVATGNYGLLDQLLVFKWVQRNIAYFGGNPNKVTIFGNSAGGSSVSLHLVSPLAAGLFSSVIAESGSSLASWAIQQRPHLWAVELAQNVGCPISPTDLLVECLRGLSAKAITKKATKANGLLVPYAPVIDGLFGGSYLPDHPEILMNAGRFHKIPFLTGLTRNEAAIWYKLVGKEAAMKELVKVMYNDVKLLLQYNDVSELNHAALLHIAMSQYYFKKGFTDISRKASVQPIIDFVSDVVFKAPCIKLVQSLSNHTTEPVYVYEFAYFSPDDVKTGGLDWVGAYHESELQFLFGLPHLNYSNTLRLDSDKHVSDLMMELWINFAKYGNPTATPHNPINVDWLPYSLAQQNYLEITQNPSMKSNYIVENSILWNSFFPIFRDYSMEFEPNPPVKETKSGWLIWFLAALVLLLGISCILLLIYFVRHRTSAKLRLINDGKSITAV